MIFPPKGFTIAEQLSILLQDMLPQLIIQKKSLMGQEKLGFFITADEDSLTQTAIGMGMAKSGDQLTSQQRQTIIKHYLESIRYKSSTMRHSIPSVRFCEGEAVLSKLIKLKLIDCMFPLHSRRCLRELQSNWVSSFWSRQPLDAITSYFGLKIAMYFSFLGHYTTWVSFPAFLGIALHFSYYFVSGLIYDLMTLVFTIVITIWSAFYVESLRKSCKILADKWSAQDDVASLSSLRIRSEFRGQVSYDEAECVTRIDYPEWKRILFQYLVTLPVMIASLIGLFYIMLSLLKFSTYWDKVVIPEKGYPAWTSWIPNIIFALVINILDSVYFRLAVRLNDGENHAYELVHENQLVSKLVVFQFVNSFLSLFYLAFIAGDMAKLQEQLIALLITRQVTGNLGETVLPVIQKALLISPKLSSSNKSNTKTKDDPGIHAAEVESLLNHYDSTYEDYLEMFIQFGYVVLFASAFPIGALCAFLNNVIEIRSDAFKLCVTCRRPFAGERVKDIGHWLQAINALVYLSILVNCALLVKSGVIKRISQDYLSETEVLLVGIMIEHMLIAAKLLIEKQKDLPFLSVNRQEIMEQMNE
jgi:anoctamin-8